MFTINAYLLRKAEELRCENLAVTEVLELPHSEFESLLDNPLRDRGYVIERCGSMGYDTSGQRCGILVLDESGGDGVLIDAQGHDYPRYTAFVPRARALVEQALAQGELAPERIQKYRPEQTLEQSGGMQFG